MTAPILIYHGFYDGPDLPTDIPTQERRYYLPRARLEEHLSFLSDNRLQAPSLPEFLANPQLNSVVLTFDDGHISNYDWAFPALGTRGFRATFFTVAGWIGQSGRVSESQLREMNQHGFCIASHGLTHTPLTQLAAHALEIELRRSREILEQILGAPVVHLAIPGGFVNRLVLDKARDAGYQHICTSRPGLARPHSILPRLSITAHTSLRDFGRLALQNPVHIRKKQLSYGVRQSCKSIIGVSRYENLQRLLFPVAPMVNK